MQCGEKARPPLARKEPDGRVAAVKSVARGRPLPHPRATAPITSLAASCGPLPHWSLPRGFITVVYFWCRCQLSIVLKVRSMCTTLLLLSVMILVVRDVFGESGPGRESWDRRQREVGEGCGGCAGGTDDVRGDGEVGDPARSGDGEDAESHRARDSGTGNYKGANVEGVAKSCGRIRDAGPIDTCRGTRLEGCVEGDN